MEQETKTNSANSSNCEAKLKRYMNKFGNLNNVEKQNRETHKRLNNLTKVVGEENIQRNRNERDLTHEALQANAPQILSNFVARHRLINGPPSSRETGWANKLKSNQLVEMTLNEMDLKVTAADTQALVAMIILNKNLKIIWFPGDKIGPDGARNIAGALKVNKTLIDLGMCMVNETTARKGHIGPEGARHIADALTVNNTLQALRLMHHRIGSKGTGYIAHALRLNNTLRLLDLSGDNQIDNACAKHIADTLTVNRTLEVLAMNGLFKNKTIGQKGAENIADALKVNNTLRTLQLNNTNVGGYGGAMIGDALRVNNRLEHLSLSRCNMTCARTITEALEVNKALQYLDISFNSIRNSGLAQFAEALEVNKTLQELNVIGCIDVGVVSRGGEQVRIETESDVGIHELREVVANKNKFNLVIGSLPWPGWAGMKKEYDVKKAIMHYVPR